MIVENLFLAIVIAAFSAFTIGLFWMSIYVKLGERTAAKPAAVGKNGPAAANDHAVI